MILLGGGKLTQMLASLVTLRVMTTLMVPAAVATVSQFSSLASLIYGVLSYPMTTFFLRHQQEWRDENVLVGNLTRLVLYFLALALVSGLTCALMQFFFPLISGARPIMCGIVLALLTLTLALTATGANGLNVFGQRGLYVLFNNLGVWTAPLIASLLFLLVSQTPTFWSLGISLGQAVSSLAFVALFLIALRTGTTKGSKIHVRAILHFAGAQSIAFILWWAQSQSYRFTLGALGLTEIVGLVATSQMITNQIVQAFTSVMGDFFMPRIMNREGALRESLGKFVDALLPAIIFFGAILVGIGPTLVRLFLSARFHDVASFITLTAALDTMWGIYAVLYYLCIARVDMRPAVWAMAIGGILNVVLVPIFARLFPPMFGTLVALTIGYISMGIFSIAAITQAVSVSWRRVLTAMALGIPPVITGLVSSHQGMGMTVDVALLIVLGLYFLGGQYLLARPWLRGGYHLQ